MSKSEHFRWKLEPVHSRFMKHERLYLKTTYSFNCFFFTDCSQQIHSTLLMRMRSWVYHILNICKYWSLISKWLIQTVWWRVIRYTNSFPIAYVLHCAQKRMQGKNQWTSIKHTSNFSFKIFAVITSKAIFLYVLLSIFILFLFKCPSTKKIMQYTGMHVGILKHHTSVFDYVAWIGEDKHTSFWFLLVQKCCWPHVVPSLTASNINQSTSVISYSTVIQNTCLGVQGFKSIIHVDIFSCTQPSVTAEYSENWKLYIHIWKC